MRRNVTIDPLARALAVEKPAITEVMSLSSGKFYCATVFIRSRRHETICKLRNRLRENMHSGRSGLVCPLCRVDVSLVASPYKAFFFRHRIEDGRCPSITRNPLSESEIRSRKYAGAQESDPHKRLKQRIMRSLAADPRFRNYAAERTWKSVAAEGGYRRPDVSCQLDDLWIAFEGQLSTTFISVVAGRRAFYRSEGGLLVWVLARFDPTNRRLTEDDILFPNNSNVLVVDEETAVASEQARRFMVKCYWRVPNVRGLDGTAIWDVRLAGFDELTLEVDRQRAFLVDVERAEREKAARLEAARDQAAREADGRLREEFLSFATRPPEQMLSYEELQARWGRFEDEFGEKGIRIPEYFNTTHGFFQILKALTSAREGRPIGWGFHSLVQIAHHLYESHPDQVLLYGFALRAYGREAQIHAEDHSGKWGPKAKHLKSAVSAGDHTYTPDLRWLDLVEFLFPEVAQLVRRFLARKQTTA